MKIQGLVFLTSVLLPVVAGAQEMASQMTCDQAIEAFEKNGVVYEEQNGQALPIRQGTPVRKANLLKCDQSESIFDTMVATKDKRQCVIAQYCE